MQNENCSLCDCRPADEDVCEQAAAIACVIEDNSSEEDKGATKDCHFTTSN